MAISWSLQQPHPVASGLPWGRSLGYLQEGGLYIYTILIEAWRPSPTAATLRDFRDAIHLSRLLLSNCYLKFAGLAAFSPLKLPLPRTLSRSFPFSRAFCSFHSISNHSFLTVKKGIQDVYSTHELTRYFHTHIDNMPPKQATLGYVKPKQQTLGCMFPAFRF